MTEIDIADDDALRFAQRVLESDAPGEDRKAARDMIVAIRTRVLKERATIADGSAALRDVADALCKQFASAGIKPLLGSMNPAEDLHARAMKALGRTPPMDGSLQ